MRAQHVIGHRPSLPETEFGSRARVKHGSVIDAVTRLLQQRI